MFTYTTIHTTLACYFLDHFLDVIFIDNRIEDYMEGRGKYGGWTKEEYDAEKAQREEDSERLQGLLAGAGSDHDPQDIRKILA